MDILCTYKITGFDVTLKSLSGGKLSYETKLSCAGLIFWFYGKLAITTVLQLDPNKVVLYKF